MQNEIITEVAEQHYEAAVEQPSLTPTMRDLWLSSIRDGLVWTDAKGTTGHGLPELLWLVSQTQMLGAQDDIQFDALSQHAKNTLTDHATVAINRLSSLHVSEAHRLAMNRLRDALKEAMRPFTSVMGHIDLNERTLKSIVEPLAIAYVGNYFAALASPLTMSHTAQTASTMLKNFLQPAGVIPVKPMAHTEGIDPQAGE